MANNNLLPTVKRNGLLNKIKIFFRSIFYKQPKTIQEPEESVKQIDSNSKSSFKEELKVEIDTEATAKKRELEYIVEKIEENPKLLNKLSIEQLENVDEYYTEELQKVDKEINKLKK